MQILVFALLMLAAVLASSVISQLVPRVSSPLIQIGLGLLIALFAGTQITIIFEGSAELFLVLFIAPLLFHEAKSIDKGTLWHNRRPVVSLAVGLVVVSAIIIGFALHWIIPSIGLAVAFALGAALGPTDAVAVASLSKETDLSTRSKSILEGESLINDASGIVAFQFALAAALTGAFSLIDAAGNFLFSFFGGIIFGIVLGYLGNFLVRKVRSWGLENTTFHVLFEVFIPFIVFLVASQFNTSGILAVVAAGLVNVISPRSAGPSISRMNIVSSSVWSVLSFTLNGIVFVLLGTQLPMAMRGTWENVHIDNFLLIAYVLGITFVLIVVRFLWITIMEHIHDRSNPAPTKRPFRATLRSAATMTLGGPKGTITLAVILTMPATIPQQELIVFLASGVIVVTLLLATFVVPLLAPKRPPQNEDAHIDDTQVTLDILRAVIEELAARQTTENRSATQLVIHSYNDRIARIKEINGIEDEAVMRLRLHALAWEQEMVEGMLASGELSPFVGYTYLSRLAHVENILEHHTGRWSARRTSWRMRTMLRSGWHRLVQKFPGARLTETTQAVRSLQIRSCIYVIEHLQNEMTSPHSTEKAEDISTLILEYQRSLRMLRNAAPSLSSLATTVDKAIDVERVGLHLELEQIQLHYEDGTLCRSSAKLLRENVLIMQLDLEDNV